MMKKEDRLHQALISELNRKWVLGEIKRKVNRIAYHSLDDKMYTKQEVVLEMFEVIKMIEDEERGNSLQHFK